MIYPIRVLVTAVGGDLGQALVKALRLSKDPLQIFGCDADINGIGPVFTNSYHVVPLAKETTRYLESLNSLCRSLKIQVVIPGSEPEISILCRLGSPPRLECGAIVVCQEAAWFDIYGDKLHTMQALEGKIKLAPFADGNDSQAVDHLLAQVGFPLVVKSRRSSGSRTLRVAHNKYELTKYIEEISLPLVQQYIDATRGEYSAGVFAYGQTETAIIFKRELGPVGCTWYAETSYDSEILDYVLKISRVTALQGSVNVQVGKTDEGPLLLEINPRFSSLAAARGVSGFTDVEWSIKIALGLEIILPGDYKHIRFRRFFHELIDLGEGFQALADWSPRQCTRPTSKANTR